jgi:tetratricopeptide (TPR) repeat protein
MTDQGSQVGLITKTVEKVEKKETPPVQPEAPPEPDQGKRRPRKRALVIGVAAALVIVISLGIGYTFLLKPAPEPPAKTSRRSISARRKPAQPAAQSAEAKEGADVSTSDPAQQKGAPGPSSNEADAKDEQVVETAAASEPATETLPADPEPSAKVSLGPTPGAQAEPQITASPAEEAGQEEEPVPPENEMQASTEAASGEDQGMLPEEYMEDESISLPSDEFYSEETTPSYPSQPESEWMDAAVEVSERSESRAERYYKKGASYHQQGKLNRAIESYREALIFDPDHLNTHVNLASAYLQTSRFREAEKELVYLYARKPKDEGILYNFGLLLHQTGQYVSAEAKLRKLLELDPFHLEANLLLASIYEERGGISKAVELCMRAYQINSAHPRVLYRLGRAWDMMGDPAEAAKYYGLFLSTRSEKENELELAVRDRLNYLLSQKEEQ